MEMIWILASDGTVRWLVSGGRWYISLDGTNPVLCFCFQFDKFVVVVVVVAAVTVVAQLDKGTSW